jgi:hypothetical protein
MGGAMLSEDILWSITTSPEGYAKAQQDKRFPFIVALGRAVNALNFVRSLAKLRSHEDNSPAAKRDRLNSYLFGSAIMYEVLALTEALNKPFANCPVFQNGLRLLLKDKTAQIIRHNHLNSVRNQAVFHFDQERFGEAIQVHNEPEKFCSGQGQTKGGVNFSYSDIIAVEILMGSRLYVHDVDQFNSLVAGTDALTGRFVEEAENLIRHTLADLGFQILANRTES